MSKYTQGQVDLRNLIYADTQFGHRGETDLKLAELQALVVRGWMQEGDENNEFDVTDAGRAAIAATLRQQAERSGVAVSAKFRGYVCKFCGQQTDVDPADQVAPSDYCDHSLWNEVIRGRAPLLRTAPAEQGGRVDEVDARSHERMIQAFPKLSAFFQKHGLGSKLPTSCLTCGKVGERSVTHAELPDIYVCATCTAALAQNTQGEAVGYFAANPAEGEFTTYRTLEAARAEAEKMLGYAQEDATEDGWTDEPPQICYGVVLGGCVEREGSRKPAPEGSDFSEMVDFRLTEPVHAERARVPILVAALQEIAERHSDKSVDGQIARAALAAAPSQPEDAA